MKALGIIAEYNPFHKGHAYHIEQSKKRSGCDVVVVAMSGNFVQRGEPALIEKWTRARMAMQAGADLIVELPFAFACQSAEIFAAGGVQLLSSLACQILSFASESGTTDDFNSLGKWLWQEEEHLALSLKKQQDYQLSYARQMSQLIQQNLPAESSPLDWKQANNFLGLLYSRENARLSQPMKLLRIQRQEASHQDQSFSPGQSYASASAIRRAVVEGQQFKDLDGVMFSNQAETLLSSSWTDWEKAYPFLYYQILSQGISGLAQIYQMTEGLEYRLWEKAKKTESFTELMQALKTKRYVWTRLQRLLIYVLLNIKKEDMLAELDEGLKVCRLLAMNKQGRAYLKELKEKSPSIQWVSNLNQSNAANFSMDIKAGDIYRLLHDFDIEAQDFYRFPHMKDN